MGKKVCPLCKTENIKVNNGGTITCRECHYISTTRLNHYRSHEHPFFEEYGERIKTWHKDFAYVKKVSSSTKRLIRFIRKNPNAGWARDR